LKLRQLFLKELSCKFGRLLQFIKGNENLSNSDVPDRQEDLNMNMMTNKTCLNQISYFIQEQETRIAVAIPSAALPTDNFTFYSFSIGILDNNP